MNPTHQAHLETAGMRLAARALGAIERGVLRHPLLFIPLFVLLYSYKREDFLDFAQLTQNPFLTHPVMARQFLHSSPLTLFIGWPLTFAFGAHASYAIVCSGGFVFLSFAVRLYLARMQVEQRRVMLFVAFSTPILLVLSRWLGKNDPYLLASFLLVLTYRGNAALSAVFSLLLVLSHKELGTLMLVGDGLLRWSARPPIVAGALAGNGLVFLYLASLSTPPFSRVDFALALLGQSITGWESNTVVHLLLGLGWFWLFLLARWRAPDLPRVVAVVLLCFAASFDVADYTRDFILCAFPLVVYTAENVAAVPDLAMLVTRRPFPLAFLVQMQIESFDQVRDTLWPSKLAPLLQGLWHSVS